MRLCTPLDYLIAMKCQKNLAIGGVANLGEELITAPIIPDESGQAGQAGQAGFKATRSGLTNPLHTRKDGSVPRVQDPDKSGFKATWICLSKPSGLTNGTQRSTVKKMQSILIFND